jgi:hypothetical protein
MPSDLLLLAVRYISNELPDDERAAFEDRLAHDQSAREAVAAAVELTVAVARLSPTSLDLLPMQPRRRWFSPTRVGVAAACLACAVGLALHFGRVAERGPENVPPVAGPDQPESVVLAWSGLRQNGEVDLASQSEHLAWLDEPMTSASSDHQPPGASAVEDELLPRWLLEAASLRATSGLSGAGTREN